MTDPRTPRPVAGRLLSVALRGLLPFVVFLTALRLTLTPFYVRAAYRIPGFPPDSYGFSLPERERYALVSLDYLLNDAGIEFLADQQFEDGSALFNPRELRHMRDVKALTQLALDLWIGALTASVVMGGLRARFWGWPALLADLRGGGIVTLWVMAVLAVGLVVSFQAVFVGFHRIFFEGNTWLFRFSDTLIRLFPVRFWQQVFAFLALSTAGMALGLRWLGSRWSPAREAGDYISA